MLDPAGPESSPAPRRAGPLAVKPVRHEVEQRLHPPRPPQIGMGQQPHADPGARVGEGQGLQLRRGVRDDSGESAGWLWLITGASNRDTIP